MTARKKTKVAAAALDRPAAEPDVPVVPEPGTDVPDDGDQIPPAEEPLTLDDDEDTSMVESMALHLVSEHGLVAGLHLNEVDALREHRALHPPATHSMTDLRFRPGRILAALEQAERDEASADAPLVPAQQA